MSVPTVIAVDWSGALTDSSRKTWLAAIGPNVRGIRLESGRDRTQLEHQLVEEVRCNPNLVVGVDFAFSFPEWFLRERGLADVNSLWSLAAEHGEHWLSTCEPPFWGRPKKSRPDLSEHYRRTDKEVPSMGGIKPKSAFQIGGAGAVGTGSIRGMPMLSRLKKNGFSIWPFDKVAFPLVVEIYPRLLTGPVTKGSLEGRRHFLDTHYRSLPEDIRETGTHSEDAFDALVSALVMNECANDFATLRPADDTDKLEGRIWYTRNAARELPRVALQRPRARNTSPPRRLPTSPTAAKSVKPAPTTQIGFINRNAQRVIAKTTREGSDHKQKVYQLECTMCGHVYGANGSDIHRRRCPKHQGGRPGEPLG